MPRIAAAGVDWVMRGVQDAAAERRALVAGLLAVPASIEPRYFYDRVGCALFGAICELPEYYPTRTEAAIFERHRARIAAAAGTGKQLVDLGAGDCRKAAAWMPWLRPQRYLAVDIAESTLASALAQLALEQPSLDITGVVMDFARGLDLQRELAGGPATFFYPGSSIGNFAPDEAERFLRSIRRHCRACEGSGLLIGVDTRKDPRRLEAAYADGAGVTAAFNRNVLNHVNRVLGTRFVPDAFDHVAIYDENLGRVEMHLQARSTQTVEIEGIARRFEGGSRIHTENSYKYAPQEFAAMLDRAGFDRVHCWQDDAGDFAVYYAW
ncbi:MAG TPA: L-histidine N(alpha)-methyltransferase [Casimicrobiaceae bacterium]|nr:L-histidine N(alpha)-methyltransferase [Casimicrobiaceae bacterium]